MSKELRRKLRRASSPVERRFWRLIYPLRSNGWHFRKQVELGSYYVDFACLEAGLVIEIDGDGHGGGLIQLNDATRDEYLRGRGFAVLRFSNGDVLSNPKGVFAVVVEALAASTSNLCVAPPPQPSPQGGGCRAGGLSEIEPEIPNSTLPLAGRAGEGG